MFWSELLTVIVVPVVRSVSGWLHKSLEDNKINRYEWKKLVQTVVRVGTMGVIGWFGLSMAGVDNAALAAGIGSFFADKLFDSLKENKNVSKRG